MALRGHRKGGALMFASFLFGLIAGMGIMFLFMLLIRSEEVL